MRIVALTLLVALLSLPCHGDEAAQLKKLIDNFDNEFSEVVGLKSYKKAVKQALARIHTRMVGDQPPQIETIFVNGPAGVGKTFIPNVLRKSLERYEIEWQTTRIYGNEYFSPTDVFNLVGPSKNTYSFQKDNSLYSKIDEDVTQFIVIDEYDELL